MYIFAAAPDEATADLSGIWESLALVTALSVAAGAMTLRRKGRRSSMTAHWAVLLSAHGGLVAVLHIGVVITHIGGALVITAMAERVIWDVSDVAAERVDRLIGRLTQ